MDAIQFTKSTNGTIITVGKPYLFKSGIYGATAVHVTAIHGDIIHFTIDGGEASRQVRDFPELSDGKYFAISERIVRRASKQATAAQVAKAAEKAMTEPRVQNTIREVPGVGKVAIISYDPAPVKRTSTELSTMSAMDVRAYARKHYSTIGKLTKKADIIAAIRAMESKKNEETF